MRPLLGGPAGVYRLVSPDLPAGFGWLPRPSEDSDRDVTCCFARTAPNPIRPWPHLQVGAHIRDHPGSIDQRLELGYAERERESEVVTTRTLDSIGAIAVVTRSFGLGTADTLARADVRSPAITVSCTADVTTFDADTLLDIASRLAVHHIDNGTADWTPPLTLADVPVIDPDSGPRIVIRG